MAAIFTFGGGLAAAIACSFYLFSGSIAENVVKDLSLIRSVELCGGILLLLVVKGVVVGVLNGYKNYPVIALADLLEGVVAVIMMPLLSLRFGVEGVMTGYVVSLAGGVFLLLYKSRQLILSEGIKLHFREWRENLTSAIKIALPTSVAGVFLAGSVFVANAMVVKLDQGYQYLGHYGAFLILSSTIQMLTLSFGRVLLPLYTERVSASKGVEFASFYLLWIISVVCVTPFLMFPSIFRWVFPEYYVAGESNYVIQALLVYNLILIHKQGVPRRMIRDSKMWYSALGAFQIATVLCIAMYVLSPYGALGIAMAYIVSILVNYLVMGVVFTRKKLCPRKMYFGFEEVCVWGGIVVVLVTASIGLPLLVKLAAFIAEMAVIIYLFKKIYNRELDYE